MLKRALETLGTVAGTLGYVAALVVLVGVVSHALTWLLTRKHALTWVWNYWNVLGAALMLTGIAGIGYGWLVLGLETAAGSGLAGFGLLLASAGLWMIIPI